MASSRLLIIATSPALQRLFAEALKPYAKEAEAQYVETGLAALAILRSETDPHKRPNLVIMPGELPILEPAEFVRAMKADAELQMLPVIAMASFMPGPLVDALYDAGINAVMDLPVSLDDFQRAVAMLIRVWVQCAHLPFEGRY